MFMSSDDGTSSQLTALEEECARLRQENAMLRARLQDDVSPVITLTTSGLAKSGGPTTNQSTPQEKVALFRSLFRGREDVYATRWIGKDGKAGYSPASLKDWSERDDKGRPRRIPLPLNDVAIQHHLTGRLTIGIYPLLSDETCFFLAVDFDKNGWQEDATAFLRACKKWSIPAAMERSCSGKGGHVWIFFDEAIPAILARKMGGALLTRAMEERHQIGLDSYDRFFPNQDTMPKGGFGNLIALPL